MDLGERECRKANTLAQLVLLRSISERSPRVRAFIVAVLETPARPLDRGRDRRARPAAAVGEDSLSRWPSCQVTRVGSGCSETDGLPDQDDADPPGLLLVDLENLADEAVLPVGGVRAGVLEFQAVVIDAFMGGRQGRNELLRADDEDDMGGAPGVGGELAAGSRRDDQRSVLVTACTLPRA